MYLKIKNIFDLLCNTILDIDRLSKTNQELEDIRKYDE